VYRAVRSVTADEIPYFRTLTWIRRPRLWSPTEDDILAPAPGRPILDVAMNSGFQRISETPGREILLGTRIGRSYATINFQVEPERTGGSIVKTETRVYAPDAVARRAFAAYWRIIYPGSALIRRMWLRAIKWRAEREDAGGQRGHGGQGRQGRRGGR